MSTKQINIVLEESSTQATPLRPINPAKNCTVSLEDLQTFITPINKILKTDKQISSVISLNDLTQALSQENLLLEDRIVELNPVTNVTSSVEVVLENSADGPNYLGFNTITFKTKPLENRVIDVLTPDMLTGPNGLTITKTSDDFCGMKSIEIKDIALASNLEYTLVPSDLDSSNKNSNGNYIVEFDLLKFDKFSEDIQTQYYNAETETSKVFGAKNLTLNIPLVEEHVFVVDGSMLGNTYVPADIPSNFDGTGGSEGKIGFKRVGITALLNSTVTASRVESYMLQGGDTLVTSTNSGASLGYPTIEIPPLQYAQIRFNNYYIDGNYINSYSRESTLFWYSEDSEDSGDSPEYNYYSLPLNTGSFNVYSSAVGVYGATLYGNSTSNYQLNADLFAAKGIYLTDIYNKNEADDRFQIDFWDWGGIKCPQRDGWDYPFGKGPAALVYGSVLVDAVSIDIPAAYSINLNFNDYATALSAKPELTLTKYYQDYVKTSYPAVVNKKAVISNFEISNFPYTHFKLPFTDTNLNNANITLKTDPSNNKYKIINNNNSTEKSVNYSTINPFLNLTVNFKSADRNTAYIVGIATISDVKISVNTRVSLFDLPNVDSYSVGEFTFYYDYKGGVVNMPATLNTSLPESQILFTIEQDSQTAPNITLLTSILGLDADKFKFDDYFSVAHLLLTDQGKHVFGVYLKKHFDTQYKPLLFKI